MIVLFAEALHGSVFPFGVLLAATAWVTAAFASPDTYSGNPSNVANFALTMCLYLGPLAGGAAAQIAATSRDLGQTDLARSSARGIGGARAVHVGSLAWWAATALGVAAALLSMQAGSNPIARVDAWLLMTNAWLILVICSLVGSVVGEHVTGLIAAPVTAAALFLVLWLQADGMGDDRAVALFSARVLNAFNTGNLQLLSGHVLIGLALSLMLWLVVAQPMRGERLLYGSAALMVTGVLATALAAPSMAVVGFSDRPVCAGRPAATVCLWSEDRLNLEPSAAAFAAVTAASPELLTKPTGVSQPGLDPGALPPGRLWKTVALPSGTVTPDDLRLRMVRAVVPPVSCAAHDARYPQAEKAWLDLVDLISARAGSTYVVADEIVEVTRWSPQQQLSWVEDRVAAIACRAS